VSASLATVSTEDLIVENERLHELDQMKDELIALVSHELRTPLTSIVGYLELLTEPDAEPLTEQQAKFLSIISRSAERLLSLISDLLLMAQVESGGVQLDEGALDLAAVAQDSVAAALPTASAHGVRLTADVETAVVRGDRRWLAEMVDNLLSNALKFTPDGGAVDIRVRPDGGSVRLEVADTGIGIPPEEQAQLFSRFFRTRAAVTRAVQGTGLGLSIVKAIVDAHGGAIEVESVVSEGSTFRVTLPATTGRARREAASKLARLPG
jgi:signal transduction histidine kinase